MLNTVVLNLRGFDLLPLRQPLLLIAWLLATRTSSMIEWERQWKENVAGSWAKQTHSLKFDNRKAGFRLAQIYTRHCSVALLSGPGLRIYKWRPMCVIIACVLTVFLISVLFMLCSVAGYLIAISGDVWICWLHKTILASKSSPRQPGHVGKLSWEPRVSVSASFWMPNMLKRQLCHAGGQKDFEGYGRFL